MRNELHGLKKNIGTRTKSALQSTALSIDRCKYPRKNNKTRDVTQMAIGDSLEKLIAARRAARLEPSENAWLAEREEIFAPIARRLRVLIGGIDNRFIKSRLTKDRAVIRVGNGEIDAGWEISPNSARSIDHDAPPLKVTETRDFMSEDTTSETIYFDDEDRLIDFLERRISERTLRYRQLV